MNYEEILYGKIKIILELKVRSFVCQEIQLLLANTTLETAKNMKY